MTIEELLNWPGNLANLSDAQIEEALKPYFPLMRPTNTTPPVASLLPPEAQALVDAHTKKPGMKFKLS